MATRFSTPLEYKRTQDGSTLRSRFAGMPIGALELGSDWDILDFQFHVDGDIPAAANGWTVTEVGVATQTLSADASPGHVIFTNAGADNDETNAQFVAAAGVGEIFDMSGDRAVYFDGMFRIDDANTDEDSVEQTEWFFGLANAETTVISGATDFIGFLNQDLGADAAQDIDVVAASGGSVSGALIDGLTPHATGWTTLNPTGVQATDRNNKVVGPDQWFKLAMLIEPLAEMTAVTAHYWVNDVYEGNVDVSGQTPNENVCPTVAIRNGEAVAKIMHIHRMRFGQRLRADGGGLI